MTPETVDTVNYVTITENKEIPKLTNKNIRLVRGFGLYNFKKYADIYMD